MDFLQRFRIVFLLAYSMICYGVSSHGQDREVKALLVKFYGEAALPSDVGNILDKSDINRVYKRRIDGICGRVKDNIQEVIRDS